MTTANQGKAARDSETTSQDERNAQEARGHSERVEREETVHRRTVDIDDTNKFKQSLRRVGGMWIQAACVAAGAAVGVGGTLLVQKRMNRSAVNSAHDTGAHQE
jgi:hypothetical protein